MLNDLAQDKKNIDYAKSRMFWDERADKIGEENFLLATTLQDDLPAISDYRDVTEKQHLFKKLKLDKTMKILDLGGGTGRWSITLAEKVKEVTLVDFSSKLLGIAKQRAQTEGLTNINFIESQAISFHQANTFDVILISGLLMYINDSDLKKIAANCFSMLKPGGYLVIREGVNLSARVVQIEEYVPELQCRYSVIWRKPEEYVDVFGKQLALKYWNDAFPYMVPVFFYKRIIPKDWKKNRILQSILKALLFIQSWFDAVLLEFSPGIKAYHSWLKKQRLGVTAQFFIFKKEKPKSTCFHLAGENIMDLAKDKPTPFFLIAENIIKENYNNFVKSFSPEIPLKIYYSVKTNYESGVLLYMKKMGLGAEIGSDLDLFLAQRAGFEKKEIVLDGFYKDKGLLAKAIDLKLKTINIETFDEAATINKIARQKNDKVCIGIRLRLDRYGGDWRNIITDSRQKRFGLSIRELMNNVDFIKQNCSIMVTTLMSHTAKSFTTPADYGFVLKKMFQLAAFLKKKDIIIKEFNLGGGIPEPQYSRYNLNDFGSLISGIYQRCSKKYSFTPLLSFELGKSLVGNAAVLVGRVRDLRADMLITDISRSNFGFTFPFRKRRIVIANKLNWPETQTFRVCSTNLEKFDIIKNQMQLPHACIDDIVVLENVGAYSLPLSTQFTKPRCAVYLLTENGAKVLIREQETCEDVILKQNWEL